MSKSDKAVFFVLFGASMFGAGLKDLTEILLSKTPSLTASVLSVAVGTVMAVYGGTKLE